jgi:signal transduction histidine kinase
VVSATPSPSADPAIVPRTGPRRRGGGPVGRGLARIRRLLPRSFQARLTVAFVTIIVLTLLLVGVFVLNRLDAYFTEQQEADLRVRMQTVSAYVLALADAESEGRPVVSLDGSVDPGVTRALARPTTQRFIADRIGQADVIVRFGLTVTQDGQNLFVPSSDGRAFEMRLEAQAQPGQRREVGTRQIDWFVGGGSFDRFTVEITLSAPYTYRQTAIANVTGLLVAITLFALGLSVVVSAALARRFTTPLRQLTEASRGLAEGDLTQRVPSSGLRGGPEELGALAAQFNHMADRLEQSVAIIREDRDRSRDFLADVSHELRTPLAALRTFNQLLIESAGDDPEARAEFLESSAGQIERLDWLAQNLLELSKLDSGLVLLDLRPDDLRTAVESAARQHQAAADRRGVRLVIDLPPMPVRIRHDPPRVGQVIGNLVGNAVKFTPTGGRVDVTVAETADGARIDVADTGVGIDPTELPHIFERFYRGARSSEARSSGSGLGLAIVRSIVDMHGGRVEVSSGAGTGSRFSVFLPADPRTVAGTPAARRSDVASAAQGSQRLAGVEALAAEQPPPGSGAASRDPDGHGPRAAAGRDAIPATDGSDPMTETSPSGPSWMNPTSAP